MNRWVGRATSVIGKGTVRAANVVVERVVLIGFSGSGKSAVAQRLGARLGWTAVDTDAEIEASFGATVPEIFATHGEAAFRAAERRCLAATLRRDRVVVATGGGAVVEPDAWDVDLLGRAETLVVALDARPETSFERLSAQRVAEGGAVERPMLAGGDPIGRIRSLKERRQAAYDRAHLTIVADAVSADAIANDIADLVDGNEPPALVAPDVQVRAPSGASAIVVRPGSHTRTGALARGRWPRARRAWLITDANVGPRHGPAVAASLETAAFEVRSREVAAGEGSKSLAVAGELYDWLLGGGVERGDVVVALGGGVVGDLAGFVAATCLRGVGLVQVPSSLLAMVDSSVGGKTGINHPAGKNLIGAFYQPPVVVIDPLLLRTLPPRELTSGWAEVVKHALIQPSTPDGERADLLTCLQRNADRLLALDEPVTSYVVRRNVALKAAVVDADERETGVRAFLNFGHTLGHAIEAAGYRHLHGEAVAIGMRAAARIGATVGTCDDATVARLDGLLDRFGLPDRTDADPERVHALLGSDKKRVAGRQRWVLPLAAGGVVIRDDVPHEVVREALSAVVGGDHR